MAKTRELPEILEIPFLICDNSLNRKGWRLLVEGIDREGFEKNPVCIVQHDTYSIPVGKWKNLKVENGKFTGVVEFDKNDPEAVKLYWKYRDGYMNAVSLHILPISESDSPEMLVVGQRYATITTSELLEISLVTVPGQKNAVKLCTIDGGEYKLSIVPTNNSNKMAEEKDKQEVTDLKQKLEAQYKLSAENLVKYHKQRGVVQDKEVEHLTQLAITNYESVSKLLDARTTETKDGEETDGKGGNAADSKEGKQTSNEGKMLAEAILSFTQGTGAGTKNERESWTYLDWYKKDSEGLALMQQKEPEKFKKLEADFVAESKKQGLVISED